MSETVGSQRSSDSTASACLTAVVGDMNKRKHTFSSEEGEPSMQPRNAPANSTSQSTRSSSLFSQSERSFSQASEGSITHVQSQSGSGTDRHTDKAQPIQPIRTSSTARSCSGSIHTSQHVSSIIFNQITAENSVQTSCCSRAARKATFSSTDISSQENNSNTNSSLTHRNGARSFACGAIHLPVFSGTAPGIASSTPIIQLMTCEGRAPIH
jgi:hypothetical protein